MATTPRDPELDAANESFDRKATAAFTELFDRAREANEAQFLIALGSEFRGAQSPG